MIVTARLELVPLDDALAAAIVAGAPVPGGAADFPAEGDAVVADIFQGLRLGTPPIAVATPERPWGFWVLRRKLDGQWVGGIGLKGEPVEGAIEVGYGLVPSARGQGLAREAVEALCRRAEARGVAVWAETEGENPASERVLAACGFVLTARHAGGARWDRPPARLAPA